jgi:hypothetical protein
MPDTTVTDNPEGRGLLQLYAARAAENVAHVAARTTLTEGERDAFDIVVNVCTAIAGGHRA